MFMNYKNINFLYSQTFYWQCELNRFANRANTLWTIATTVSVSIMAWITPALKCIAMRKFGTKTVPWSLEKKDQVGILCKLVFICSNSYTAALFTLQITYSRPETSLQARQSTERVLQWLQMLRGRHFVRLHQKSLRQVGLQQGRKPEEAPDVRARYVLQKVLQQLHLPGKWPRSGMHGHGLRRRDLQWWWKPKWCCWWKRGSEERRGRGIEGS